MKISITSMILWGGGYLTEINDEAVESEEQYQNARTCRLILLYILKKMVTNGWIRVNHLANNTILTLSEK